MAHLPDFVAEGGEGEGRQFQVLYGEGDADDGKGEEHGEECMREHDPDAADDQPDDVHERGETPGRSRPVGDFPAEGEQRQERQLDALDAERDADDREAQYDAADQVFKENEYPAEHDPDDVADKAHSVLLILVSLSLRIYGHFCCKFV